PDQVDIDGERDVPARDRLHTPRLGQVLGFDLFLVVPALDAAHHPLETALAAQVALPAPFDAHCPEPIAGAVAAPLELRERVCVHLAHVTDEVRRELAV